MNHQNWLNDYWRAKRIARYWATIALENHKTGLPWELAAKQAHDAIRYALMIC